MYIVCTVNNAKCKFVHLLMYTVLYVDCIKHSVYISNV